MTPDSDDIERHYRRLRESAGLLDLGAWAVLRLRGPDTGSFLQGIATQDLSDPEPGRARITLFLTEKGRPLALAWVALEADGTAATVIADEGARPLLREHCERFLVMEDVEISAPDPAPRLLGVAGPERATLLARIATQIAGSIAFASDPLSFLLAPEGAAEPTTGELAPAEAFEAWRLAVGLPRTGVDFDLQRIATELSLPEAISMTKGCYVGQEVVARTSNRGQVRRHRAGFRFACGAAPIPPRAEIRAGEAAAGFVTSSAAEPGTGDAIAMGYVSAELPAEATLRLVLAEGRSEELRPAAWPA
jgi:folate-binding protein YgfZ